MLTTSCHTFEHRNIFIETAKKKFQPNIINNQESFELFQKEILSLSHELSTKNKHLIVV